MRLISTTLAGPGTAPIIGDALRSVAPIVDSRMVIWTGANPEMPHDFLDALDILDPHDAAVQWWPWCNDFGGARQAALDFVRPMLGTADFSVMTDTDERVVCPDPAALRAYLAALPADVAIVCVHTQEGTYSRERFFRGDIKSRWYLRTHETIDDTPGARRVVAPRSLITWSELPKDEATVRSKCERDLAMLLLDLADHPGNGRVLFYLGNTLEHLGRYDEAISYYRKVSEIGIGEGPAWACFSAAYCNLQIVPLTAERIRKAYDACFGAIYREPRLAEPYWYAGEIALRMDRPDLALALGQLAKVLRAGTAHAESVSGFRVPFALDGGPDRVIAQARMALHAKRGIGVVADNVEFSGERRVVEMVRERVKGRPVVFDVGANRGQWARMARSVLGPEAEIHCFEPSSIARGIEHDITEHVHEMALGDENGTAFLRWDVAGSGLASLHVRSGQTDSGRVNVRRLDEWLAGRNRSIDRIDLLKVDVEGHEIHVLRGAAGMLSAGKIDAIQFEFGGACVDSRVFLRDFFDLLVPHGFAIHRVTPTGIEPVTYSEREEVFVSSNFLALRKVATEPDGQRVMDIIVGGDYPSEGTGITLTFGKGTVVPNEAPSDPVRAIVFSRDRPMQLDACLRSLRAQCSDAAALAVHVLFRFTSEEYAQAYREVATANPWAVFVPEVDFEADTRALLAGCEHVLFVVDDTVFVRPFAVSEMVEDLKSDPGSIGYSLRLGSNCVRCYPASREQSVPETVAHTIGGTPCAFDWTTADGDFGYPLEVSSSLYRATDILSMIPRGEGLANPNALEEWLSWRALELTTREGHPRLLCAPLSLAFSVPANRVQTTHANRAGDNAAMTADALLERWGAGWRINVGALAGYTPNACHEEVAYAFERRPMAGHIEYAHMAPSEQRVEFVPRVEGVPPMPPSAPRPISITVTSTGFRAAEWAPRCIESVGRQTFKAEHVYVAADSETWSAALSSSADLRNGEDRGLLANLLPVWRSLPPDEVIVWLDGDDWLAQDHALERIAAAHRAGALVTYGSFMYSDGRMGFAGQCADDPRTEPWRGTHLKSFRAGLVQRIRDEDLQWPHGSWLDLAIDQAVMLPCLEMAGRSRSVFVPEVLAVYNEPHGFAANADAAELAREAEALRLVRGRKRYARIEGL